MSSRYIIVPRVSVRARVLQRASSRAVTVPRAVARAVLTSISNPVVITLSPLVTQGGNFITTQGGDQLVAES